MLQGMAAMAAAMGLEGQAQSAGSGAVFELRVYHCYEGKLPGLLKRFREHTMALFERHGITNVGYWTPVDDGPLKDRTLFYMIKYPSREEAKVRWKAFATDPEWKVVSAASEVDGKLVEKVDCTFLVLTDFSPKL
jgi:hypothetical protein